MSDITKAFRYAARVVDGEDVMWGALKRANAHYNGCINAHRENIATFRRIRSEVIGAADCETELEQINADLDRLYQEKKAIRSHTRGRDQAGEINERMRALAARRKELAAQVKIHNANFRAKLSAVDELAKPLKTQWMQEHPEAGETLGARGKANVWAWETLAERGDVPTWRGALLESDRALKAAVKSSRAAAGLVSGSWGIYTQVEAAAQAARAATKGRPLRNRGFRGEGLLSTADLRGKDGRLRTADLFSGELRQATFSLVEHHDGTTTQTVKGGKATVVRPLSERKARRGHRIAMATIRVGNNDDGSPQLITLRVIMHRPLPNGSLRGPLRLRVERHGTRTVCSVIVTVGYAPIAKPRRQKGVVAINFGWRSVDGHRLRVATTVDDRGHEHVFELASTKCGRLNEHGAPLEPATSRNVKSRIEFARSIQSASDLCFEQMRAAFIARRKDIAPEWLLEETKGISTQWRNQRRFRRWVWRWANEIFDSDTISDMWNKWKSSFLETDLFQAQKTAAEWSASCGLTDDEAFVWWLVTWAKKSDHLLNYSDGVARKARADRLNQYRNIAAQLAAGYEKVIHDGASLKALALKPGPTDDTRSKQEDKAQANRQLASVYSLKEAITMKVGKDRFVKTSGAHGATHHNCGGKLTGLKAEIHATCGKCGAIVDQDINHCRNMMARHFEGLGGVEPLA